MSPARFRVRVHVFPGQHIRHYPGATRNGDSDTQSLEVKQYTPIDNPNPADGDITIIAAPGTSFPKELYEPLWDELLACSTSNGFRIRSIWAVDPNFSAASGVINEETLGDDPSYMDFARDLLSMTNHFREHMVQPVVGFGHSIGATSLIEVSRMHPALFSSLVMIDPIITQDSTAMAPALIHMATTKQDLFPSREMAEKIFQKAFRTWDARALKLYLQYALRDTPTKLYPEAGLVTLQTPKAIECWSYGRPQWEPPNQDGSLSTIGRIIFPDADPNIRPFYRPEADEAMQSLPYLRPSALFVFPEHSPVQEKSRHFLLNRTGTARGGSGGVAEGRVALASVGEAGHLCTFEKPAESAAVVAAWLATDLHKWNERRRVEQRNRYRKSVDQLRLSDEWVEQARLFKKHKFAKVPPKL